MFNTYCRQRSITNEEPLLPLKTILSNLKCFAENVRKDQIFCWYMAYQLRDNDYHVEEFHCAKQVMKALALAVNEAIQEKVNLSQINNDPKEYLQLEKLLEVPPSKSLHDYFVDRTIPLGAGSPFDMASDLKKNVPQWLVRNIIQHQFDIKWCTLTGKPDDYNFYQFYAMEDTTNLLKYGPRLDQVQATLYKECRSIYDAQSIIESKEQLCPTVYIKTNCGWRTWQADEDIFTHGENIIDDLSWIDPDILRFITENADVQRGDTESLENTLKSKPTLYWAVLQDDDVIDVERALELESISETQVYVGKANNGIRGRWTKDKDNHCEMMKRCLDNVCAMTTYDPLRLEGIQLVDARLALAKVRQVTEPTPALFPKTALFVIKTFGDDVEKAELKLEASYKVITECSQEIQMRRSHPIFEGGDVMIDECKICGYQQIFSHFAEKSSDEIQAELDTVQDYLDVVEEYLNKVELPFFDDHEMVYNKTRLQEELHEARACVDDFRNASNTSKPVAEELLKKTEKRHRIGKRDIGTNLNIIPYKVLKGTWLPKDMRYGMNRD